MDTAVGPIKQRERGFGAGQLLAGLAAAQLAGEDFLTIRPLLADTFGSESVQVRNLDKQADRLTSAIQR